MANKCFRSFMLRGVAVMALIPLGPGAVAIGHAQRVATSTAEHAREAQRITVDVENVPLATVLYTIAHQAGLMPVFVPGAIPATKRVTLHLHEVAVAEAFERVLRGTGLVANVHAEGDVTIMRGAGTIAISGTITGRVIAATTKQPLRGVKVGLDGTDRVTETEEDGSYRFSNVGAGSYTITVKFLGYAKASRSVAVQDNATTTVDMALELSATPLDQVVVTGTVIPTELRAVPNAITVITAKQLEERGITHIDQLFRGDVPGLFAQNNGSMSALGEVTMYSRGATATSGQFASDVANTNPIKTYIDGVEMADPKYLSQIDPKNIERIEILTGPQASTIYGSNAMNGVMQIFTKRGTSNTPQLTLNLLNGWVESNLNNALTPQQDYSVQVSGLEGRLSYNAGGSWNAVGRWNPAMHVSNTGVFGGVRFDYQTIRGRVTTDFTVRRNSTQNLQRGSAEALTSYRETGWYRVSSAKGLSSPTTFGLDGQTLGLTLGYVPTTWWSHEFGIGRDVSEVERRVTGRGYGAVFDTTLSFAQSHTDRRSLRYTTTAQVSMTAMARATITIGADNWQNVIDSLFVSSQTLTGTLAGPTSIFRLPGHNTGTFLQTQVGVKDRLFLTYGLRMEWNPSFGAAAQPNYAPRYGVAYTQELNALTVKLRGSYGRSTRPPAVALKNARRIPAGSDEYWGPIDIQFANPDLGPEFQKGGEGGLELYWGNRGSLVVTRYNQTVDDLIYSTVVDSANWLPQWQTQYGFDNWWELRKYLNIAGIRNQGWELQETMNAGPFALKGIYSWTKSRSLGATAKYLAQYPASLFPQLQPGATFQYLPEHTWAVGVTYARSRTTLAINLNGIGQIQKDKNEFYFRNLEPSIRLVRSQLNVSSAQYLSFSKEYALADFVASQRISSRMDGQLQVQNLGNYYVNDNYGAYPTMGRQIKLGLRWRND